MLEVLTTLIALTVLYLLAALWIEHRKSPTHDEDWFALVPVGCVVGLGIALVIVLVWG